MHSIDERLKRLERRPTSLIPIYTVELENGETVTAHGYELLRLTGVERVLYAPSQPCAGELLGLFRALNPGVEICERA